MLVSHYIINSFGIKKQYDFYNISFGIKCYKLMLYNTVGLIVSAKEVNYISIAR